MMFKKLTGWVKGLLCVHDYKWDPDVNNWKWTINCDFFECPKCGDVVCIDREQNHRNNERQYWLFKEEENKRQAIKRAERKASRDTFRRNYTKSKSKG